jgi:hypothetical protein
MSWFNKLLRGVGLTNTSWIGVYNAVSLYLTPVTYVKDLESNYKNMLEYNIKNILVPEINNLAPHIKRTVFGGPHKKITRKDIHYDLFEEILCPEMAENSVFRVNEELEGSKFNHLFLVSNPKDKNETKYFPRTISVYENKGRAEAAFELMKILSEGSGAEIVLEKLHLNGQDKWIVSDNLSLQATNSQIAFFKYLAKSDMGQLEKQQRKEESQNKINVIVDSWITGKNGESKKMSWEAWEGVPTIFTVKARPGVKLIEREYNGNGKYKHSVDDSNILSLIPDQSLPRFMQNLPEIHNIKKDGRLFEIHGKSWIEDIIQKKLGTPTAISFIKIGKTLIGDDMYDGVCRLKTDSLINAFKKEFSVNNAKKIATAAGKPLPIQVLVIGSKIIATTAKMIIHPLTSSFYLGLKTALPKLDFMKGFRDFTEKKSGIKLDGGHLTDDIEPETNKVSITLAHTQDCNPITLLSYKGSKVKGNDRTVKP